MSNVTVPILVVEPKNTDADGVRRQISADIDQIVQEGATGLSPTLSELDEKKFPQPANLHQLLRLNNKTDNSASISNVNQSASRMHAVNNINTQNLIESQSSGGRRIRHSGQEFIEDSETPDHDTLGQRTFDNNAQGGYKRSLVLQQPLNTVQENIQFRTAQLYSGHLKQRAIQTKPVSPGEPLPGKLFQINIREEVQAMRPAIVMRQAISHTSQGPRQKKPNAVSNLYINANVHLQSERNLDTNRFSSSGTRKTMREKAISGIKSMRSSEDRSGHQLSPPQSPEQQDSHYNRRLLTQRFTHRGSHQQNLFHHTDVSTLKISDTPRDSNFPRLKLKSGNQKVPHIKQLDDLYNRTNTTGIIIQEQHKLGSQTILMHQLSARNNKALSEQNVLFDPYLRHQRMNTDIAQYTDGMGNLVHFRGDSRKPLVNLGFENEGISDEQCIVKNSYNVIQTTHPHHERRSTAQHNRAVFKVVSQTTTASNSKPRFGDDSTENSMRNGTNRLSSALSEQENVYFHPDGTIKPLLVSDSEDEHNGFKDFITLPIYFQRQEKLLKRFRKRKNQKTFQMNILPLDFIIFNGIYPRIYSIKNQLRGTVERPQLEFNPTHLTQHEIFIIKSASYLYSHEYDKAKYFLDQGLGAWPARTFEFRFNLALYHYLNKEFSESVSLLKVLLQDLEHSEQSHSESTLNRILSVVLNLMLSLIKDNHRYKDILAIQHNALYQRIRMMTNPVNLKIQKLLNYSTAQMLKQRAQSLNGSDHEHSRSAHSDESNLQGNSSDQREDHQQSKNQSAKRSLSPDGSLIADHAKGKRIKYQVFQKRGGSDFPLKNKRRLQHIKIQKTIEREKKAMIPNKKPLESADALLFGATPRGSVDTQQPPLTARQKFQKVLKQNKAAFFKVESIQNVQSPDYVLSMGEIIQRLANKEDIQQNKHLMYQLTQLDEIVRSNTQQTEGGDTTTIDEHPKDDAIERSPIIPFPFEMNEIQKRNPLYRDQIEAVDRQKEEQLLDLCMRNLEELRLEVSKEFGGEFDQIDPVYDHFKMLCNSIFALLKEENLMDIIVEAKKQLRDEGAMKMLSSKKVSIAKEILLSALLRRKKSRLNVKNLADDELVEIELLQENIKQLKDIMLEEQRNSSKQNQSMDYMQKIEREINRMLVNARKKQREREKHQKQEEEDRQMNIDPRSTEHLSADFLIATKSLSSLLRRSRFQKMISERFKVEPRKYQEAFELKRGIVTQAPKFKSGDLTKEVLSKFKIVDPDQYSKLLERTKGFLQYLFDNYGGYFIANQTYCLTEFLDLAPPHIMNFFENTAITLTTIPLRLPSLADTHDDNSWGDLYAREFIYNKDDIMQKFLSEGLRHPKVIEYMGLEKHSWIVEVTQKFNMLAVLNQIFREAIKVCSFKKQMKQGEESDEDPDLILKKAESSQNMKPIDAFLSADSLNAIKDQYARLKYQGSTFNMKLVNKLIGEQIPIFKQFSIEIRNKMFVKCHLRSILVEETTQTQYIDVDALDKDHILVILNGNILIQEKHVELQKQTVIERYEKGKRVEVIIPPGPPLDVWVSCQVLGPGMAIPVQHLKWLLEKKPEWRIVANKDRGLDEVEYEGTSLDIDYLEYDKKELANLVFTPVLHSLLKKVELIQNVDIFNGDSPAANQRLEALSPYVMFSLAALCKVQVFNMSELIIEQNEIPKAMFVILEGQAKTVYEDTLNRKGEVCPYSRRSLRTDLPKELKFGLKDFAYHQQGPIKTSKNQMNINGDNLILNQDLSKVNSSREVNTVEIKSSQHQLMSTTFHNQVHNHNWTEHQPAKNISFRHHIEFGFLTEGHYVASRVVLDEGAIKNFIKSSRHKVKEWLLNSQQQVRTPITQTMKAGFIKMGSTVKEQRESEEIDSDNSSIASLDNETVNDLSMTQKSSTPMNAGMNLMSKTPISGLSSFAQLKEGLQAKLHHYESQLDMKKLKQYLMSSQLSVVVTSSTLKAMVIYKSDKGYFNEPVKKLLTEMIQDRDFLDLDRPMEEGKNLDFIRNTQKQWEQYKYKFEEHSLRESFHQKYEQFPR